VDLSCRNPNESRPEFQYEMPMAGQLGTEESDAEHRPSPCSSSKPTTRSAYRPALL